MTHIRKAIFPVAGLGTRFLPATKAVPKELLPLVDRPLLDYALEEARAAGIEEFIFVNAPGKEAIARHVSPAPKLEESLAAGGKTDILADLTATVLPVDKTHFVVQDQALGLGHAVWCARDLIGDEPFAVILPDDVIAADQTCLAQMIAAHRATGGNMIATMDVGPDAISAYGAMDVVEYQGRLARARGMVEKPKSHEAPSTLAAIGRYILQPLVLDALGDQGRGAGGEIQLTDAIARTTRDVGLWGYRFDGQRFDCGSKAGYLAATIAFGLARADLRDGLLQTIASHIPPAAAVA